MALALMEIGKMVRPDCFLTVDGYLNMQKINGGLLSL